MDFLHALGAMLHQILTDGIGPVFDAHAAPQLYPFILGGLVASLLSFLGHLAFAKPDTPFRKRLGTQTPMLIGQVLGIYAIWLAYSTPVTSLFALPQWGVVVVIAAVVHAALAIGGAVMVLSTTIDQFAIPPNRLSGALAVIACVLLAAGWESEAWPMLLVVAGELLLAYAAAYYLAGILTDPKTFYADKPTWTGWQYTVVSLLRMFGLAYVVFAHPIAEPWLDLGMLTNLVGLYLVFAQLDELAIGLATWRQEARRAAAKAGRVTATAARETARPVRFYVTAPLALLIGLLGSQAIFAPVLPNTGLTPLIWIEASVAGAVYLIFRPLADWAGTKTREAANQAAAASYINLKSKAISDETYRKAYEEELRSKPWKRSPGRWGAWVFDHEAVVEKERQEAAKVARLKAQQAEQGVRQVAQQRGEAAGGAIVSVGSVALIFSLAIVAFALLAEHFGLSLTFGTNWAPTISWALGLAASQLPFVSLRFGRWAREDPARVKTIFGPMANASLLIVSVVGLSDQALKLALPAQGPAADMVAQVTQVDPRLVDGVIQTIHVMGWIGAVLVLVGYLVSIGTIYRSRYRLLPPPMVKAPVTSTRERQKVTAPVS
jgi:hypothetical protein